MKAPRLRNKLLLGAVFICLLMAVTSMLAVSWVVRGQFLKQSEAHLSRASRIVKDSLGERKNNQLIASRQLATQKNLGSTIWYLAQYAQADFNREMLLVTYQQLVKDTYKTGRVAKLSKIAIYDASGHLVSFASFGKGGEMVGFVEHHPGPVFQVANLKEGDELSRDNMRRMNAVSGVSFGFGGPLPQEERVHYVVEGGMLALEALVPITGEAFDALSGKREVRQLGLVATTQPLGPDFVEQITRLTDTGVNVFAAQNFAVGSLPAYRNCNWQGALRADGTVFNEVVIAGAPYYQSLMPLYNGKQQVGAIAALSSGESVKKNIWEMIATLGLITLICLLLILPFAWYMANSISHPLTILSRNFRGVASGREILGPELGELKERQGDELGDLAQSFLAMNEAVKQKIAQINEINATLEEKVAQRTHELRLANHELTKLATHDALTGLPNRQLLSDRLAQALAVARRDRTHLALMFIDLDEFKPVNDSYGHAIGDELLIRVAGRIHACIRESDTVSRIGGDEFIVLLPTVEEAHGVRDVAEKIRASLSQPFELAGLSLRISSSIGVALYPEHGADESALFKNADDAMYEAKKNGRNRVMLSGSAF